MLASAALYCLGAKRSHSNDQGLIVVFRNVFSGLFGLAVICGGSAVHAQPPISNPTQVVANYNMTALEAILTELNIPHSRQTRGDGVPYLRSQINGLNILLVPSACQAGSCKGLEMVTFFFDHTATVENIQKYNQFHKPTRMFVDQNGRTFFTRYLIGDYGYTKGSFVVNLAVFNRSPRIYFENFPAQNSMSNTVSYDVEVLPAAETVLYRPGQIAPTDDLAEDLNRSQISAPEVNDHGGDVTISDIHNTALSKSGEQISFNLPAEQSSSDYDYSDLPSEVGNSISK